MNEAKEAAFVTFSEIRGQAQLWRTTAERWRSLREDLRTFLYDLHQQWGQIRVVFAGAGTSCYTGDVLAPYLTAHGLPGFSFDSVATTDLVSDPRHFLTTQPTLLVSFARSGNSPESVGALAVAGECLPQLAELAITCAAEGQLATQSEGKPNARVFLLDERCNDRGFAMTASFTNMLLAALLVFDRATDEEKEKRLAALYEMGDFAASAETEGRFEKLANEGFARVVYLGSGSLGRLSREAQLKILELTAGKIATAFDTSMGFRHGPKSFVDTQTLLVDFVSGDAYTAQYDEDILRELRGDQIAKRVLALRVGNAPAGDGDEDPADNFRFPANELPDAWRAPALIIPAQWFAAWSAVHIHNDVDNPSASGTVNRVVKGVSIHPYKKQE